MAAQHVRNLQNLKNHWYLSECVLVCQEVTGALFGLREHNVESESAVHSRAKSGTDHDQSGVPQAIF